MKYHSKSDPWVLIIPIILFIIFLIIILKYFNILLLLVFITIFLFSCIISFISAIRPKYIYNIDNGVLYISYGFPISYESFDIKDFRIIYNKKYISNMDIKGGFPAFKNQKENYYLGQGDISNWIAIDSNNRNNAYIWVTPNNVDSFIQELRNINNKIIILK